MYVGPTFPLSGVVQVTVGVGTPVALHTRRTLTPVVVKMVLGVSHARAGVMVIRGAATERGGRWGRGGGRWEREEREVGKRGREVGKRGEGGGE